MNDLIEISELRIGNILSYKGELHYVSMISLDIDDEYQEIIGVTPIGKRSGEKSDWNRALVNDLKRERLSEEWFLRFGFEKGETFDFGIHFKKVPIYTKDYFNFMLSHGTYSYVVKRYDGGTSENWEEETELSFVHELQNLFFALEKKELIIA